jgi:hypothetical protein
VAKFLGLGVVGVEFVFLSLLARSSLSLLEEEEEEEGEGEGEEEEEEEEEELEKDEELLLFFMLSSMAFTDALLSTLAVCLERSPEAESEEELPMPIGLWQSSSMALLST